MIRFVSLAIVALLVAVSVSACGRRGAPADPPGTTYPGQYPNR